MTNSGRTFQQQLVWHQLTKALADTEAASEYIDEKATKLISATTAIAAIFTGLGMVPGVNSESTPLDDLCLGLICVAAFLVLGFAVRLFRPCDHTLPCSSDVNSLYDLYIVKDEDVAFNQAMIDTASCYRDAVKTNQLKGDALHAMVRSLQFQIAAIGAAAVVRIIA